MKKLTIILLLCLSIGFIYTAAVAAAPATEDTSSYTYPISESGVVNTPECTYLTKVTFSKDLIPFFKTGATLKITERNTSFLDTYHLFLPDLISEENTMYTISEDTVQFGVFFTVSGKDNKPVTIGIPGTFTFAYPANNTKKLFLGEFYNGKWHQCPLHALGNNRWQAEYQTLDAYYVLLAVDKGTVNPFTGAPLPTVTQTPATQKTAEPATLTGTTSGNISSANEIKTASPIKTAIDKGLTYLASRQADDAGIVEEKMLTSTISPTWFTVNAVVAAGENPIGGRWVKNNKTFLTYLLQSDSKSDGTGEIAKWITYAAACGVDPHTYGGYNAVSALKDKISADGKGGQYVYTTYWTIFGLIAAGENASAPLSWLLSQQLDNGGFDSYGKDYSTDSDADNTAAAIMAMIAAGLSPDAEPVKKAISYLRVIQEDNGGFNYGSYSSANLASSVWAIQAFCAAGIDPSTVCKNGKSPVDYVLSLQKEDGSFKYTESLTDSPAGMTARAIAALCGKPYPILPGKAGSTISCGNISAKSPITPVATTPVYNPAGDWRPVTVTDDFGYTVTINAKPQRIISLAPTNTEILFAVGAGDRVIGVTEYCDYPQEATTRTIIGGYSTPNIEKIVSLNPDLIVAYYGNGLDTINHLKTLGYTVITLNSDSLNGSYRGIELIGETVGCREEASALISTMKAELTGLQNKRPKDINKPVVIHCLWTDPLWVSGAHTFEDEMISAAGGINGASFIDGWGIITTEKILTLDPDIIVVDNGMGMGANANDVLKNYFESDPRLKSLSAVKNKKIFIMHADLIDRGGPRIIEAVKYLSQIIHPEIYGAYTQFHEKTVSTPGFGITGLAGIIGTGLLLRRRT